MEILQLKFIIAEIKKKNLNSLKSRQTIQKISKPEHRIEESI